MLETPILFKAEMVRAILDGRKTQTRRIVKRTAPSWDAVRVSGGAPTLWDAWAGDDVATHSITCPYGVSGDRLYLKETWRPRVATLSLENEDSPGISVRYEADGAEGYFEDECIPDGWSLPKAATRGNVSPLYMPRWASRITLELTGVRVERLQEITGGDVVAEGVCARLCDCEQCARSLTYCPAVETDLLSDYAELWDEINGKRAPWAENVWVWVLEFRRLGQEARAA